MNVASQRCLLSISVSTTSQNCIMFLPRIRIAGSAERVVS